MDIPYTIGFITILIVFWLLGYAHGTRKERQDADNRERARKMTPDEFWGRTPRPDPEVDKLGRLR